MQFTFNCYCHWSTLVVCDTDGSLHFLHIKEGVNQGDSLAIIDYVIVILPLIHEIHSAHPHAMQPWYVDDTGAGGKSAAI